MNENAQVSYVLIINDEMFISKTFITEIPKPGGIVRVLGIIFNCKNKNKELKLNEPIIAEIAINRHAPVKPCIDILLANGFTQLCTDEVKELRHHFLNDEKQPEEELVGQ
jgi:hypothetical protein